MTPTKEVMAIAELIYDHIKRETANPEMSTAVLTIVSVLLSYDTISAQSKEFTGTVPGYGI